MNRPLASIMQAIYNRRLCKRRTFKGRRTWSQEDLTTIRTMVDKNITVEEIAEHFQVDVNKIKTKAVHLGYPHGDLNTKFKTSRRKSS
jgi:D-alanyl-D-alanine carboxypeptidase